MGRITRLHCGFFLLAVIPFSFLLAGNGKLSGRILDAQTGNPIAGNVQIAGTLYGSAADSTGRYFILGIPPGTYDIRCSAVGYRAQVLTGLVLAADRFRTQNFLLDPEEVDLAEIVVQADRMAVQSSQTSARTDFDGAEFRSLPMNSTMDLIALSPGTFKQFIGGASPVFSRTTIDGIDVTDESALWFADMAGLSFPPTTTLQGGISVSQNHRGRDLSDAQHTSFAEPNINAIEQSTLFTGTTGADYAGAVGTLAYTLREGRGAWGGEAMVRVSQLGGLRHLGPDVYWDAHAYLTERAALAGSDFLSGRQKANFYTWFPGKYPYRNRPDVTASLALGGSLAEGVGLHVTGAYHSSGNRLPNEKTERFNGSAKFTWNVSPTMRLSVVGLLEDRGRLFGWKNSSYVERFRYFLEGVPLWDGLHLTGGVRWVHFLSQKTSYEIHVGVVHDNTRRGFCDDNNDGVITPGEDADFLTWSDPAQVRRYQAASVGKEFDKFFVAPGTESESITYLLGSTWQWYVARPPIYYEDFASRVVSLKGDISSQVNSHHLVAAGSELRLHTIAREVRSGSNRESDVISYVGDIWTKHPTDLGFFLQDRMEFSGLILNVGIRLEGTLLDAAPIANWYAPPDTIVNAQGGVSLRARRGSPLPWSWFLSPRVAVSHSIGHTAAVHMSISRTRLSPPYSYIFANYDLPWQSYFGAVINIGQEPITSMNYDLGIQWAVASATLLGVNAYSREYANMNPASFSVYARSQTPYYAISNALSADTKGFELSLERDLTPLTFGVMAGGRIAYGFSNLTSGVPTGISKYAFSSLTGDSAAYDGRLPFGDMAAWDRSYIEVLGGGSAYTKGFNRNHRVTCAFMIAFPGEFRLSGTGMFNSGFWYPEKLKADYILPYAQSPWNRRIDIRLEKKFLIAEKLHLDLFIDILNVCNWVNVLAYYEFPETAQSAWEIQGDPTGGPGINRPVTYDGTLIYDIPREVYFGVRLGF
jgi:hypothetical protein